MTNHGDDAQPLDSDPTTAAAEPIDAEIVDLPPSGPVAPSYEEVTGYTTSGVPTFDHVREKIERRTTTALGAEELGLPSRMQLQDIQLPLRVRQGLGDLAAQPAADEFGGSLGVGRAAFVDRLDDQREVADRDAVFQQQSQHGQKMLGRDLVGDHRSRHHHGSGRAVGACGRLNRPVHPCTALL